jgi:hypothetical protein
MVLFPVSKHPTLLFLINNVRSRVCKMIAL